MRWKVEERQEESGTRDTSLSLFLSATLSRGPPWSSNNSRNLLIPARTTMSSTWRERLSNTFLPALIRIRRSSARIKRSSSRNDALSSREDDWECGEGGGEKEMATIYGEKGRGGRKEKRKKEKKKKVIFAAIREISPVLLVNARPMVIDESCYAAA